jgi:Transposase, Mutator family
VSTRKVEALVQALGIAGLSKSEVSRLAASLDEQVAAFRTRRLDAAYPYLWLDARYEHVREDGRVVSMAVIVAYGVRADGVREVLGLDIGLSEDVALWRAFLQDLVARGVRGVQLVVSDAHQGLKQAIREVFVGVPLGRAELGGPGAGRLGSRPAPGSGRGQSITARAVQAVASRRRGGTPAVSREKPRPRSRIRAWPRQKVFAVPVSLNRRMGRTRPLRNWWSRSSPLFKYLDDRCSAPGRTARSAGG